MSDHPPDDDRGDLARVAVGVVHLTALGLEVAHAERHCLFGIERVGPSQPLVPYGADVLAEELQDPALIWIDDEESGQADDVHGHDQDTRQNHRHIPILGSADEEQDGQPQDR